MQPESRVKLAGSERTAMPGARVAGKIPPQERFEVTVRLRPAAPLPSGADFMRDEPVRWRRYMSRASYAKKLSLIHISSVQITMAARSRNRGLDSPELTPPSLRVLSLPCASGVLGSAEPARTRTRFRKRTPATRRGEGCFGLH